MSLKNLLCICVLLFGYAAQAQYIVIDNSGTHQVSTNPAYHMGALVVSNASFIATGNGVATYQNTNSFAVTNGSGFVVIDGNGSQTNAGPIGTGVRAVNTSGGQYYIKSGDSGFGLNSAGFIGADNAGTLPSIGFVGNNAGSWTAIGLSPGTSASAILTISNRTHLGVNKVLKVDGTAGQDLLTVQTNGQVTVAYSVTATNGFFLPQLSAIPSVDLRSSSGNTNWLVFNLGGDLYAISTNATGAGLYYTNKLTNLETVSSLVAFGSAVALSTTTPANITSISVPAGTWDITGNCNIGVAGATVTQGAAAINTTSATLSTDGSEVYIPLSGSSISYTGSGTIPTKRLTFAVTTTVYLVGMANFSVGTAAGYGKIVANRVY